MASPYGSPDAPSAVGLPISGAETDRASGLLPPALSDAGSSIGRALVRLLARPSNPAAAFSVAPIASATPSSQKCGASPRWRGSSARSSSYLAWMGALSWPCAERNSRLSAWPLSSNRATCTASLAKRGPGARCSGGKTSTTCRVRVSRPSGRQARPRSATRGGTAHEELEHTAERQLQHVNRASATAPQQSFSCSSR